MRVPFRAILSVIAAAMTLSPAMAQQADALPANAEASLRAADEGYWRAYNACDEAAMIPFFADDVEFYHDKGGLSRSRATVVGDTMKNLCSNPAFRLRRAVVPDSVRFDPIPGYGGVLSGEHLFFVTEKGMPERESGRARFVMVWRYDEGTWRMTRVLSLGHLPVPYVAPRASAVLSDAQLRRYVGSYRLAGAGKVTVAIEAGALVLRTDKQRLTLAARSDGHFFTTERPLMIDFTRDAAGRATGLAVTENGVIADRGERVD
ncbi:MAG: DUF4440 domain-containing protein [Pseudomonadota bacterium]